MTMARTPAPPEFWTVMCTRFLGASPKLATELWGAYAKKFPYTSVTTRFQLDRLYSASTPTAVEQRLAHLEGLLPPRHLMDAALYLSPEGPAPRRHDIVRFEAQLLRRVARDGTWR